MLLDFGPIMNITPRSALGCNVEGCRLGRILQKKKKGLRIAPKSLCFSW